MQQKGECLPPQVHHEEHDEGEEPRPGAQDDEEPARSDLVPVDQVASEQDGDPTQGCDRDEDEGESE